MVWSVSVPRSFSPSLHNLLMRLRWDPLLEHQLGQVRLVFMPLVNPGGMLLHRRANPAGIDLMRNAPLDAAERVAWLVGGHRAGGWLPWYRGAADAAMQTESAALCEVVEQELLGRPVALALDCHSGFGLRDRIWFPLAGSRRPIDILGEIYTLKNLFDQPIPTTTMYSNPRAATTSRMAICGITSICAHAKPANICSSP